MSMSYFKFRMTQNLNFYISKPLCLWFLITMAIIIYVTIYFDIANNGSPYSCKFPHFKVNETSFVRFLPSIDKPVCNLGFPPIIYSDGHKIKRNNLEFIDTHKLDCCYRTFWMKNITGSLPEDFYNISNTCISFGREKVMSNEEFIQVTCSFDNKTIYEDYFAFVPHKPITENIDTSDIGGSAMNILVIGMDYMSQLQVKRKLPLTVDYLLKNLSALEFRMFNRNYQSLIEFILLENAQGCHGLHENVIWKYFEERGYVTAFGEEQSFNGVFSKYKCVYDEQPLIYYWNTFDILLHHRIGHTQIDDTNFCVGSMYYHNKQLQYIKQFIDRMKLEKLFFFGMFWLNSIGRKLNQAASYADQDIKNAFEYFHNSGTLNNTIILFLSLSGSKASYFKGPTYQMTMEENMPFLYILLPNWFKNKYPKAHENIMTNRKRLISSFDIQRTLQYLANQSEYLSDKNINTRRLEDVRKYSHVYSLFDLISKNRTCASMGIPALVCTCTHWKEDTDV